MSEKFSDDGNISRCRALSVLGGALLSGAAIFSLAACSSEEKNKTTSGTKTKSTAYSSSSTYSSSSSSSTECSTLPEETAGPFPGDGSNSNSAGEADILVENDVVRSDIKSNLDGSNTQQGVAMTLKMKIVDVEKYCAPASGYSIYLWHANRDGNYSMYNSNGANHTDDTFLRGVQITDTNGDVTFKTILPGRYSGRAAHYHFEVYSDSNYQTGKPILTSQIAFDDDQVDELYEKASDYKNKSSTHNNQDNVFSDGYNTQSLKVSGDIKNGLTGTITVGV